MNNIDKEIEQLKAKAKRGELTRRSFIGGLLQLGIALPVAGSMASALASPSAHDWTERPLLQSFDYIIVGAGSAGCVMADRLSASGASVLLIEAGGSDISQATVVDGQRWVENVGSHLDWSRPITPQPWLNHRPVTAAAGKIIGGGGSINGMLWFRGDQRDLRQWRRLVGSRWAPWRINRAYQRVENYLPGNNAYRSTSGTIEVSRYAHSNPITAASIAGAGELGLRSVDHNASRRFDGVGIADVNIRANGYRSGPAQTYLARAIQRPNLSVLTDATVTSLTLHHSTCVGVNAVINGRLEHIAAQQEVLLCAGTFGSPRLLMQSGIGPIDKLQQANITVQHELKRVGENLHDHTIVQNIVFEKGPELSPHETLGRVASHSFLRTNPRREAPNIQVMCMQGVFPPNPNATNQGFNIMPWLGKPKSRGSLTLTSADPSAPLVINPAYLTEREDRNTLIEALDYSIAWGMTNSMIPFAKSLSLPLTPNMKRSEKLEFLQSNTTPGFHCVGTCSAGRSSDDSVVDQSFKVWGLDNLRIIDASVIPEIPCANPHGLILTLAELAAEELGCV